MKTPYVMLGPGKAKISLRVEMKLVRYTIGYVRCDDGEGQRELRVLAVEPLVFKPLGTHDVEYRLEPGDADGLVEAHGEPEEPKRRVDGDREERVKACFDEQRRVEEYSQRGESTAGDVEDQTAAMCVSVDCS